MDSFDEELPEANWKAADEVNCDLNPMPSPSTLYLCSLQSTSVATINKQLTPNHSTGPKWMLTQTQNLRNMNVNSKESTPPSRQYVDIYTPTAGAGQDAHSSSQVITQIPEIYTSTPNNDITINQYFYPTDESAAPQMFAPNMFLYLLRQEKRSKKRSARRRARRQEKIQISKGKLAGKEAVCLTDIDDSLDVEIVGNLQEIQGHDKSDEDEVIYVEPSPVTVISVEDNSEEEKAESEHDIDISACASQDEASNANDFFLPANTCENEHFNFSLHGSDFQDVELATPANPNIDIYETESSTSTLDFKESSRSFSKRVKTVVFPEVDFPNEDIFEGESLEKFDNFITPRREPMVARYKRKKIEKISKVLNVNPRPSESSRESDYSESHKKLSPMISQQVPLRKKLKKSKRRSSQLPNNIEPAEEELRTKKAKRKHAANCIEEDLASQKKSKSQKKINIDKRIEEVIARIVAQYDQHENISKKPKQSDELEEDTTAYLEPDGGKKKTKRNKLDTSKSKKRCKEKIKDARVEECHIGDSVDTETKETLKKKAKKRKKKNAEKVSPTQVEEAQPEPVEKVSTSSSSSSQKTKRKKKTSLDNTSKLPPVDKEVEANKESSEVTNEEEKVSRRPVQKRPKGKVTLEDHSEEERQEDGKRVELQEEEGDIVLIEPVVPIHTIESSSEDDDDVLGLTDKGLTDKLALANITSDKPTNEPTSVQFDVETLQNNMPDDPDKWKVLPSDISYAPDKYIIKRRCRRCRQMGHLAVHCTNKSSIPVCSMCGVEGHQEPRCPNKVCFSCARPGNYSLVYCNECDKLRSRKCGTCNLQGHTTICCPDTWRRYYLTIDEGPLVKPRNKKHRVPKDQRWCSGCASSGHYEDTCSSYKWIREYPCTSQRVFLYQEPFNNSRMPKRRYPEPIELRNKVNVNRKRSKPESTITSEPASLVIEPPPGSLIIEPPPEPAPAGTELSTSTSNFVPSKPPTTTAPTAPPGYNKVQRDGKRGHTQRLNRLSFMRNTGYRPYQSMLNPWTINSNSINRPPTTFSSIPSIMDLETIYNAATCFGGRYAQTSQNQINLYNSAPPLMAQQVSNPWGSVEHQIQNLVTSYQGTQESFYGRGGEYNYTQDSYYGTTNQFEQRVFNR